MNLSGKPVVFQLDKPIHSIIVLIQII